MQTWKNNRKLSTQNQLLFKILIYVHAIVKFAKKNYESHACLPCKELILTVHASKLRGAFQNCSPKWTNSGKPFKWEIPELRRAKGDENTSLKYVKLALNIHKTYSKYIKLKYIRSKCSYTIYESILPVAVFIWKEVLKIHIIFINTKVNIFKSSFTYLEQIIYLAQAFYI